MLAVTLASATELPNKVRNSFIAVGLSFDSRSLALDADKVKLLPLEQLLRGGRQFLVAVGGVLLEQLAVLLRIERLVAGELTKVLRFIFGRFELGDGDFRSSRSRSPAVVARRGLGHHGSA